MKIIIFSENQLRERETLTNRSEKKKSITIHEKQKYHLNSLTKQPALYIFSFFLIVREVENRYSAPNNQLRWWKTVICGMMTGGESRRGEGRGGKEINGH